MKQSKVGRTEIGFAVSGAVAIVTSFLPWFTVSFRGLGELLGEGGSVSANAWKLGMGAWFPMLLIFALGVLAALPAFGVDVKVPGGLPLIGAAAGVLGTVIVLLRWLTLPGGSVG